LVDAPASKSGPFKGAGSNPLWVNPNNGENCVKRRRENL